MTHKINTSFTTALIFVILLVGAYLRLNKISEYMTFLGDEGRDALVVKRMIVERKFTLLGPTASVGGFFLGPIYDYFMLPFLWLWNLDPVGPAVMVALFGTATIYLVYLLGKSLFEPIAGLIASSLYALSPVVIAYSRSSWNPNIVPFFSVILVYIIWRVSVLNKLRELLFIGIILGIGLQLHYLFLFLLCMVVIWFAIFGRTSKNISYFLLGLAGFLVAYSPFILFELRHDFTNTLTVLRFLQQGSDTGYSYDTFINNTSDVVFRLFARLVFRYPTVAAWEKLPFWVQLIWGTSILAMIAVSSLMVLKHIIKYYIHKKNNIYLSSENYKNMTLLIFWIVIPIVLFGLYKRSIYDYYFGIIFPVPFLFTGLVLARLYRLKRGALLGGIIWVAMLILLWNGRPFIYPGNNQLTQVKKIAGAALSKTGGKPFNFALIANFNSDHAYRYFFEIWGNKPVALENAAVDPQRKTVTDQLIVICELDDCQPLGHPLWEIAGFGRAQIVSESYVPFVKIYKLRHY